MKIYDISMSIHENMPVYKNRADKKPKLVSERNQGGVYESRLEMNLHTGTHIDAPMHMLSEGRTTEDYPLERFIVPCKVFDFRNLKVIGAEELQAKDIQKNDFILLKTDNSEIDDFASDFTYLSANAAEYLKEKGILGVGIDALGIERDQTNHETHKTLLQAGIVILEGLRLKNIKEGRYLLVALPLKIAGVEAAPVRAILLDEIFG